VQEIKLKKHILLAFIATGVLSGMEGEPLIDAANAIIAALGG
jgi:hypothetical protein